MAFGLITTGTGADETQEQQPTGRRPAYQRNRMPAGLPLWAHQPYRELPRRQPDRRPPHHGHPHPAQRRHSGGAWFQRPYPYHLDYYRMRYGGTYEPYYSGGLYGTPQVVVPPAFGFGYGQPAVPYGVPLVVPEPVPELTQPPRN